MLRYDMVWFGYGVVQLSSCTMTFFARNKELRNSSRFNNALVAALQLASGDRHIGTHLLEAYGALSSPTIWHKREIISMMMRFVTIQSNQSNFQIHEMS